METAVAVTTKHAPGAVIGRPTLYREEYPERMVEYFTERSLGLRMVAAEGGPAEQARAVCSQVPTFQGFANSIGVTPKCVGEWAQRHPAFGEAHARAKAIQEQWFADALSTGIANPTGAIFVAKNMLGWRDKIDIEQTSSADAAGMSDLKAMMQVGTQEELSAFSGIIDTWQKRLAAQGLAVPGSS